MTVQLPPSVQNYFTGKNERDFAVAASGFARSAVVKDEGRDHVGPAAIREWIEASTARYDDRANVRSAAPSETGVEVLAQVSGTFPGSPILLRFGFSLSGAEITRLEIGT
jgi:hypothetical protein